MAVGEHLKKAVEHAAEKYAENTIFRASIQGIPYVGGPLDTLLAGRGSKLIAERQLRLIGSLSEKVSLLEADKVDLDFLQSENYLHLLMKALDHAARTSHQERIQLLAQALVSSATKAWGADKVDNSEALLDLAASLTLQEVTALGELVEMTRRPWEASDGFEAQSEAVADWAREAPRNVVVRLQARGLVWQQPTRNIRSMAFEYNATTLGIDLINFLKAAIPDADRNGDHPTAAGGKD